VSVAWAASVAFEALLPVDNSASVGDDDELDAVARSELHQDSGDVGLGGEWAQLEGPAVSALVRLWAMRLRTSRSRLVSSSSPSWLMLEDGYRREL
jgi:hypothetical protein